MNTLKHAQAVSAAHDRPRWSVYAIGGTPHIHVIPDCDIGDHCVGDECPCGPRSELWANGSIGWIHAAYDGRDLVEACERGQVL